MSIARLKVGQIITAGYWFDRPGCRDDYSVIVGNVVKILSEDTVVVHVTECSFGNFTGKRLSIGRRTEIISINN